MTISQYRSRALTRSCFARGIRFACASLAKFACASLSSVVLFVTFVEVSNVHAQEQAAPGAPDASHAPAAASESPALDALAAKMAKAITQSKEKSVVVVDFVGPEQNPTALGQTLTDEFSAALAKNQPTLKVLGRTAIAKEFAINHFDPLMAVLAPCHPVLVENLNTKSCLSGVFTLQGDALTLKIMLVRFPNFKRIEDYEKQEERSDAIPVTPEMAEAGKNILLDDHILDYPKAGENGYSWPACVDCQYVPLTNWVVGPTHLGVVLLAVVVGDDGAVEEIKVLKPSSHELTRSVIHTVSDWKFDPARRKDGQPVAAWIVLNVGDRRMGNRF